MIPKIAFKGLKNISCTFLQIVTNLLQFKEIIFKCENAVVAFRRKRKNHCRINFHDYFVEKKVYS